MIDPHAPNKQCKEKKKHILTYAPSIIYAKAEGLSATIAHNIFYNHILGVENDKRRNSFHIYICIYILYTCIAIYMYVYIDNRIHGLYIICFYSTKYLFHEKNDPYTVFFVIITRHLLVPHTRSLYVVKSSMALSIM